MYSSFFCGATCIYSSHTSQDGHIDGWQLQLVGLVLVRYGLGIASVILWAHWSAIAIYRVLQLDLWTSHLQPCSAAAVDESTYSGA